MRRPRRDSAFGPPRAHFIFENNQCQSQNEQQPCEIPRERSERIALALQKIKFLQALLNLFNLSSSSFLTGYISSKDVTVRGYLIAVIVLSVNAFSFTVLSKWCGNHLCGFNRRSCVWLFFAFDICCAGLMVAELSALGVAGLPWKCDGLTEHKDGVSFDSTVKDNELNHFCGFPKANWALALILLLSYIFTASASIRLILALGAQRQQERRDIESHQFVNLHKSNASSVISADAPPTPQLRNSVITTTTSLSTTTPTNATPIQPQRPATAPLPMPPQPATSLQSQQFSQPQQQLGPQIQIQNPSPRSQQQPGPSDPQTLDSFDEDQAALIADGPWASAGPTPAAAPAPPPSYEEAQKGRREPPSS